MNSHQSLPKGTLSTVELFAGIGGFRIAADKLGLRTLWANDNSPKAGLVYRDRFTKDGFCEGDINDCWEQVPPHDVLTAGFPCQPFSSAGKKQGFRDPRGHLIQRVADVLRLSIPRYFVLENVKRLLSMEQGCHFATILSLLMDLGYHLEWRLVNAKQLGLPQNRQRVLIIGEHLDKAGRSGCPAVRLASESDLGSISGTRSFKLLNFDHWKKIERHDRRFPTWGVAHSGRFVGADLLNLSDAHPPVFMKDFLEAEVDPRFDYTVSTLERIKHSEPVGRFVGGVEILYNQAGGARMGYTVFGINGVCPTLTATESRHYERYKINGTFRRLTNVEYARYQGFQDEHCSAASIYDQYALYGNAVPPIMAEWALSSLLRNPLDLQNIPGHQGWMSFSNDD